jgi:hypothetical protein
MSQSSITSSSESRPRSQSNSSEPRSRSGSASSTSSSGSSSSSSAEDSPASSVGGEDELGTKENSSSLLNPTSQAEGSIIPNTCRESSAEIPPFTEFLELTSE